MTGYVKSVKTTYGFIKSGPNEYFFHRDSFNGHWNDLVEDMSLEGQHIQVEFTPEESPKGLRASEVRRVQFPNAGR